MQMNEMFLFSVTKEGVNSVRRHALLLLVVRKCFRGDGTILI